MGKENPGFIGRIKSLFSPKLSGEAAKTPEKNYNELIKNPTVENLHSLLATDYARIVSILGRPYSTLAQRNVLNPEHEEPYITSDERKNGIMFGYFRPMGKNGYFTTTVIYPLATDDGEKVATSFQLSVDPQSKEKPLSKQMRVIIERINGEGKITETNYLNIIKGSSNFELRNSGNEENSDPTEVEIDRIGIAQQMYGYLARHHKHASEAI